MRQHRIQRVRHRGTLLDPALGLPSTGLSLQFKLPLLITALLTVITAAGVVFAHAAVRRSAASAARDRLALVSQQLGSMTVASLRPALAGIDSVASDARVTGFLAAGGTDSAAAAAVVRVRLTRPNPPAAMVIHDAAHHPRLRVGALPRGVSPLTSPSVPGGAAVAARGVPAPSAGDFITAQGKAWFWLQRPVRHGGNTIGYVAELRRVTTSPDAGQRLSALLGGGMQVFYANASPGTWIGLDGSLVPAPQGWPFSGARRYRRAGARRVANATAVVGTPWLIVTEARESDLLAGAGAFLGRSILGAVLLCGLGALGAWLLSRGIVRPVRELHAATEALAGGDYTRRTSIASRDEFGVLAHRFNWMAARVEATHAAIIDQNLQLQETAAELEIQAEETLTTAAELQQTAELLQAIIDSSPLAVVAFDPAHHVQLWNRAAERIFGWSAAEVLGRPSPLSTAADAEARRIAGAHGSEAIETRRTRRDGQEVEVSLVTAVLRDEQGQDVGLVRIYADLTERNVAQASLRRTAAQLAHSQKMDSVGRLAGGIAHDFNNLLTVINGNVEMALLDAPDGPLREELEETLRAVQRATGLTRQLLAFSRKQVMEPRQVRLEQLVGEVHTLLQRVIGEDIELEAELEPGIWPVSVDAGQLEQVLVNLAVNARDAMPGGGRLTIRVSNTSSPSERPAAVRETAPEGDCVLVSVCDSGMGMDEDTRRVAFEPFFTTKTEGKGTGLGLAMVHGIVVQSGGAVGIESAPGKGTRVHICLPRAAAAEGASTPPSTDAASTGGPGGSILLVEDEPGVRAVTARILRRAGYRVVEAAGGEAALQRADEAQGRFDLVLSDVVMPGMSGPALLARLRGRYPTLRCVLMSGYTGDAVDTRTTTHERAELIEKPFSPETLLGRIGAVLGQGEALAADQERTALSTGY